MKKIFLFLFFLVLTSKKSWSQTDTTCATATPLPPSYISIGNVQNIGQEWYSFVALSPQSVAFIRNTNLPAHVHTLKVYGGTCSSLTLLTSTSVMPSPGDSTIYTIFNTTIGSTYYLQVLKDSSCLKCGLPNATYNIAVTPVGVATTCTSPTPCDYVLNGSFEGISYCPTFINASSNYPYPGACWYSPSTTSPAATPDYFNSCANSSCTVPANCPGSPINAYTTIAVNSHTAGPGNAYAGIYAFLGGHPASGYREYIQEQLNGTLQAGTTYTVSFWVQLANTSAFSVGSLQAALHSGYVAQPTPFTAMINVMPFQISGTAPSTAGTWVQISLPPYVANGTEDHITIGNFNTDLGSALGSGPGNQSYAYYYIDDVSITSSINLTVSPNSASVCAGCSKGPVVLTATASNGVSPYTYSWSPTTGLTPSSGIGPVVTACPTATTTYTVTVTDAIGCTQSATVTVTVNPTPTVTVGPNLTTLCIGQSVVLTASGSPGSTYSWSPAAGLNVTTGAVVIATPAVTTTYTVTATNSSGCSATATATVIVDPNICCISPTAVYNSNFSTSSTAPFNSAFVTGGIYEIGPGVVMTVDNNLIITNCTLRMDPTSSIQVIPNMTFTIANHSHLYSCTNMWNGIFLQNKSNLFVGDSWIEDALIAVESTLRSNYTINTSVFNRNQVNIQVDPSVTVPHPGIIQNTIFTCRNISVVPFPTVSALKPTLTTLPLANLKPPFSGNRTGLGIDINKVLSISIGVTALNNENLFDNMDDGIRTRESSATIKCNIFQYMQGNTLSSCSTCPVIGVAISANEVVAPTTVHNITIGGSLQSEPNTIIDCARGIDVIGGFGNIVALYNTILMSSTSPNTALTNIIGQMGIYVSPNATSTINVSNNGVTNCNVGIMQARPTIAVGGSMIYNHNIIQANASGHCLTAMNMQSPANNLLPLLFEVQSNIITESNTCINALNLKQFSMFISFNACDIRYKLAGFQKGIALLGCNRVTVNNNHVDCPPILTINPPAYATGGNLFNYGIHLQLSPVNLVQCNLVENVGRSMVFEGSCISSSYTSTTPSAGILQNTMRNSQDGFVLKTNGIIGRQGSGFLNIPSNNYWDLLLPSVFSRSQTFSENTTALMTNVLSPLYNDHTLAGSQSTWPQPSANKSFPLGNNYTNAGLPLASTALPPCTFVPPAAVPAGPDLAMAMRLMVEDTTIYPMLNSESHFIQKQHVFLTLDQDSTLCIGDSCLQNFYANGIAGNAGLFRQVDKDISQGLYNQAKNINNTIHPVNAIEDNQKEYNKVFIRTLLHPNQAVTIPEMTLLTSIALQCPLVGGNSVYQSRALINLINRDAADFTDNCDSLPIHHGRMASYKNIKTVAPVNSNQVKLYPNPNDGNMVFEYALNDGESGWIRIFDLTGKEVSGYQLALESSILNINQLGVNNGIYVYHFEVNGKTVKTGKLVIIQ